ncbi:unnamed protein product [Linum trigynum]|uniref:Uncharacterized protein n=1 Tax=Linum trigynum TaxID=586398 RepID=A0AAV2D1H7_9ROSI
MNAAISKRIFKPLGELEALVSEMPVVTEVDTQEARHDPDQKPDPEPTPAEAKQTAKAQQMRRGNAHDGDLVPFRPFLFATATQAVVIKTLLAFSSRFL